jgi:hypothetical protein
MIRKPLPGHGTPLLAEFLRMGEMPQFPVIIWYFLIIQQQ